MTHRVGIIGAGRIAQEHARAILAIGSEVAAVCDIDRAKAQHLMNVPAVSDVDADAASRTRVIDSVDELLAMDDVPAVVVSVPNSLHRDLAIAALRAGKDVLLEKPMGLSVAQCDDIIKAERATSRFVQMGFVCRYAPRVAAVRELIDSGELGTIYHAKATLFRKRGIPGLGKWFTTRAQSGGGVLIDLGVHLIDLLMHMTRQTRADRVSGACESRFGTPITSYAYDEMWAGPPDPNGTFDVEDGACGLIRFPGGMTAELNITWAANIPDGLYRDGILLLGDRGGCFFDLWADQFVMTRQRDGRVVDEHPEFDNSEAWNRAWNGQHETFRRCVTDRTPPSASTTAGRHVQQVIAAMYASSDVAREIDVQN